MSTVSGTIRALWTLPGVVIRKEAGIFLYRYLGILPAGMTLHVQRVLFPYNRAEPFKPFDPFGHLREGLDGVPERALFQGLLLVEKGNDNLRGEVHQLWIIFF